MQKFLSTLLRFKLIYHDKTTYDGKPFREGSALKRPASEPLALARP